MGQGYDLFKRLSARQREVLRMICYGHAVSEIARALAITPATVRAHLGVARRVYAVSSTAQLVALAAEERHRI